MTPSGKSVFPVVLLEVDNIITRTLTDTGAGSSYVSAKVGNLLTKIHCDTSTKRVEMLMGSHLTRMETYNVVIESLYGSFKMDTKLTKVNKNELLTVDHPHYKDVKAKYTHLSPSLTMTRKINYRYMPSLAWATTPEVKEKSGFTTI